MGVGFGGHAAAHVNAAHRTPPGTDWYARWIVTQPEPKKQWRVTPTRPAIAHVRLYDGTWADVPVSVVARGVGVLCVVQDVSGGPTGTRRWCAWVDVDAVHPA